MFKTLRNAWNIPELRQKLLFTLLMIVLYRIGSVIPVPYVDPSLLTAASNYADSSLLTYFTLIAGDAFSRATLFALSVSPYITASIVMQLLTVAIPALQRMAKDGGDEGRKKIDRITRYVTVALALITAYGYYRYLDAQHYLLNTGMNKFFVGVVIVGCYCAGAALIMWLGERIDEKGIGNGISVILFINILSSIPNMISQFWNVNYLNVINSQHWMNWGWFIALAILVIAVVVVAIGFIVFVTNAERRIPVQYAKKVVGRKMYGGQSSNLPIKLNMTGVMPIIFAQSIVSIPATIALIAPGKAPTGYADGNYTIQNFSQWWYVFTNKWFSYSSWIYIVLFLVLIIAFAYFYVTISFDPLEVSNNLKKNGGFVPGIRPGRPTSDYIRKILNRITLIGALFLALVAIVPLIVNTTLSGNLGIVAFGGSSLLIIVGVALETVRDLEAQMTMRHYKGFLE